MCPIVKMGKTLRPEKRYDAMGQKAKEKTLRKAYGNRHNKDNSSFIISE